MSENKESKEVTISSERLAELLEAEEELFEQEAIKTKRGIRPKNFNAFLFIRITFL